MASDLAKSSEESPREVAHGGAPRNYSLAATIALPLIVGAILIVAWDRAVVNYPNENDFTRITEFKYLTAQEHSGTSIVREFPRAEGDPYYPIPRPDNEALYQRYKALADAEPDTTFVGRLAQYRYYNMDQVVAAALKAVEPLVEAAKGETVRG